MNLREWLRKGEDQLSASPHPERARRDAETLLLHLIGKNRAWLLTHLDDDFAGCTAIRFAALLDRRCKGEPIQYITGETEFYGLPFRVTHDVLIPRPETEHLVEKVLSLAVDFRHPRVLDIGTGSGAIAIALAHHLSLQIADEHNLSKGTSFNPSKSSEALSSAERFGASKGTGFSPYVPPAQSRGAIAPEGSSSTNPSVPQITAIDISASALAIAEENAKRNGAAIRFLQGDLLTPVSPAGMEPEVFDIIVSNPPYVSITDRPSLSVEVRDHEPALALYAGDDGLDIYRRLIPAAFAALAPGGYLALEIGCGQALPIESLLADSGFADIEFTSDLQGIPRVASARRP